MCVWFDIKGVSVTLRQQHPTILGKTSPRCLASKLRIPTRFGLVVGDVGCWCGVVIMLIVDLLRKGSTCLCIKTRGA